MCGIDGRLRKLPLIKIIAMRYSQSLRTFLLPALLTLGSALPAKAQVKTGEGETAQVTLNAPVEAVYKIAVDSIRFYEGIKSLLMADGQSARISHSFDRRVDKCEKFYGSHGGCSLSSVYQNNGYETEKSQCVENAKKRLYRKLTRQGLKPLSLGQIEVRIAYFRSMLPVESNLAVNQ